MAEATSLTSGKGKVAVIGSGLIGRSFAKLFASVGYNVHVYDSNEDQIKDALEDIHSQLSKLQDIGLLKGNLSAEEQFKLIQVAPDLEKCVADAIYIQECIPERLQFKQDMFAKLDKLVSSDKTIMASSTSAIPASRFTENLNHRSQCIVVHPVYPPYYVPLMELIPAPWTNPEVTSRTKEVMSEIGQQPIVFKKEVEGFGVNRIQYAIARACWQLVEDGALEPGDVDKILKYGLGMRYAFIGNFETMHMNGFGFLDNLKRYGESMSRVLNDFGPIPDFNPESETAKKIFDAMNKEIPVEGLPARRKWRDDRLVALAKLKKEMGDD